MRGNNHINGVKFILINQSVERFSGEMGKAAKNDYLFFIHSFLWAFAPWSILVYVAMANRLKNLLKRKEEWLTTGVFIVMLLIVSFSGFKLPHYLNIVFPVSAIIAAAFIISKQHNAGWIKKIFTVQIITVVLLLLVAAVLNGWAFPPKRGWVIAGTIVLLAVVFYFIKSGLYSSLQKAITISVAAMVFVFFLLNSNFYPLLLTYQGGNELAFAARKKISADEVYFWKDNYSSSFNFYTASLRKPFADTVLQPGKKIWLLYDIQYEEEIKKAGYQLTPRYSAIDYEITRLNLKFINPLQREKECTRLVLAEMEK